MVKAGVLAPLALAILMVPLAIAMGVAGAWARPGPSGDGLLVVVSFPNLADDLALLLCPEDQVVSIVPSGADPHDYQLTPGDVELLRRADLVVSTAHTPFETEIRRLHDEGEIGARLVEVPFIPGMRILANPATGQPNYHMPIYDPGNYRVFLLFLGHVLAGLRPERAQDYLLRASEAVRALDELVSSTPTLNVVAVADLPFAQYAVSWLGVEVRFLLVKEHGVPATPSDIKAIKEGMAKGQIRLAVVCEPTEMSASRELEDMARACGVPVLYVPSPVAPGSVLAKLAQVSERARAIKENMSAGGGATPGPGHYLALATALLALLALSGVVVLYARD